MTKKEKKKAGIGQVFEARIVWNMNVLGELLDFAVMSIKQLWQLQKTVEATKEKL